MKIPLHLAKDNEVQSIGLKPLSPAEQQSKVLEGMEEYRQQFRSLMVMLETCTKCGACAKQCHSYLGTEDFNNIPAARADLFRKIYKRYFTFTGKMMAKFSGAEDIDHETLGRWVTYFYQCNEWQQHT